jgi:hypothetical protein
MCCHHADGLYEGPRALWAVYRYEKIWMPMYAAAPDSVRATLIPPLDVAWVWHVHRLAPSKYETYCMDAFGKPLHLENGAQAFRFTEGAGEPGSSCAGASTQLPSAGALHRIIIASRRTHVQHHVQDHNF